MKGGVVDIENGGDGPGGGGGCGRLYVWSRIAFAACGGLMFGYDIGISGGVTGMNDFLIKFFPHVYQRKLRAREDNYCKFNDPWLQLFTSSLYWAALLASLIASWVCKKLGRKVTILAASVFFLTGVACSAAAPSLWLLILGRILLGFGVGFGNEAVPLYLSEIAPPESRGAMNIAFQLLITVGIFLANLVNYGTSKLHPNGWRVSLGLAGVPALILFIGSVVISDTPTSLVERGKEGEGERVLKKLRRTDDVGLEFREIQASCRRAKEANVSFLEVFRNRNNWPPLMVGMSLQVFQQFTGINAIMFYAPVLFQTVGFGSDASLISAVVTGVINVLSTFLAIYAVDRFGRRGLLIVSCFIMLASQGAIGGIFLGKLGPTGELSKVLGGLVVVLVCLYVCSFAWSWGPIGWLIPSETFPLETRTVGFSLAVATNMACTAIIGQFFLSMMCQMRAFIFFFFGACIVVMGLCAYFLLPETKNVPIDQMAEMAWKRHRFWRRFMDIYI